jgi:hypothetical protein
MNLRTMARVFGVVFLLVGILGFVPGITQMHESHSGLVVGGPGHGYLLGLFHVNLLHNLVHILFGVWGLIAAGALDTSRVYFRGVGVIYIVLALLGLISVANVYNTFGLIPIHGHNVWLHALLGVAGLYLGFAAKATDVTDMTTTAPPI